MEYDDGEHDTSQLPFWADDIHLAQPERVHATRFSAPVGQLLKWIGNKQRFAQAIIALLPASYKTYHEPFLGSGAVLAALAPARAEGADIFGPLIDIWLTLRFEPGQVKHWYARRYNRIARIGKTEAYAEAQEAYRIMPNGADLLFLSRVCYGGVVRFRQRDGFMSTPCGPHAPISPETFASRVDDWSRRVRGTTFYNRSFEASLARAGAGDIVYCDPPYSHSQAILYGAQTFSLARLMECIGTAKKRGAFVALSIDGSKKSGRQLCDVPIPEGLFAREEMLNVGRSMLRRFQMGGATLESELVRDRLLLTG